MTSTLARLTQFHLGAQDFRNGIINLKAFRDNDYKRGYNAAKQQTLSQELNAL